MKGVFHIVYLIHSHYMYKYDQIFFIIKCLYNYRVSLLFTKTFLLRLCEISISQRAVVLLSSHCYQVGFTNNAYMYVPLIHSFFEQQQWQVNCSDLYLPAYSCISQDYVRKEIPFLEVTQESLIKYHLQMCTSAKRYQQGC